MSAAFSSHPTLNSESSFSSSLSMGGNLYGTFGRSGKIEGRGIKLVLEVYRSSRTTLPY